MNIYKQIGRLFFVAALLAVMVISFGPVAPVRADEPLADVQTSPTNIAINNLSGKTLALTVSGDSGFYAQADIGAGESMSFVTSTADGPLVDGQYKYELMTTSGSDGAQLKAQTGSFKIVNGLIVPHVKNKSLRP